VPQTLMLNQGSPGPSQNFQIYRDFIYMSLEFLIRVLLIKRNFTLLSKALGNEHPPMFPKTGPPWKRTPISRALLNISFGVPSKGAVPSGSPHRARAGRERERETLHFQSPSSCVSKSLVNEPPSRFPSGAPMERNARLQSLP